MKKTELFRSVIDEMEGQGFSIVQQDLHRPWGGFLVIDEAQSKQFIQTYFSHMPVSDFAGFSKLSPKILMVAPGNRLSWQYHNRRAEIWKVIRGKAGVVVSDTDEQSEVKTLPIGSIITLKQGERHRLVGVEEWGILAEIWQHTDPNFPSDENDIVRLQDDYGR